MGQMGSAVGSGGGMAAAPGAAAGAGGLGAAGAALSSAMPYVALAQGGMQMIDAAQEPARQAGAQSQAAYGQNQANAWQSPGYQEFANSFWE